MKLVINVCFGGFSLSPEGERMLAKLQGKEIYFYKQTKYEFQGGENEYQRTDNPPNELFLFTLTRNLGEKFSDFPNEEGLWFDSRQTPRNDPNLLEVVKSLKELAAGRCAKLKIVKIPDGIDWVIEEYDGNEWVAEKHRTWR